MGLNNPPVAGPGAHVQIAATAGTGSSGTISFTSIPQIYRHLFVTFDCLTSSGAGSAVIQIKVNGDTGANYDYIERYTPTGTTTTASEAFGQTVGRIAYAGGTTLGIGFHYGAWLQDYARTSFHKSYHATGAFKSANTTGNIFFEEFQGFWRSTAAITQLDFILASGNFTAGSVITLYGVV